MAKKDKYVDIDLRGNSIQNGRFEEVSSLPTTNLFVGRKVCYGGKDYMYNGTAWTNDATTLNGQDSSFYRNVSNLVRPDFTKNDVPFVLRSMFDMVRADRLYFLPADQIIIEQSTDAGVTWITAGVTDSKKASLFTGALATIPIPLKNGVRSCDCMIRITITAMKYDQTAATGETDRYNYWSSNYVQSRERYCQLSDAFVWLNSVTDNIYLKVETATGLNPNSFTNIREAFFYGYDGGNYVYMPTSTFGGSITQTSNRWNIRFTFRTCSSTNTFNDSDLSASTTTSIQSISRIKCTGMNVYAYSNNLMFNDHLYSWDANKNATFPASVVSNETFNFDANIEPTQTGTSPKTNLWTIQYLLQGVKYNYTLLKDLLTYIGNRIVSSIRNVTVNTRFQVNPGTAAGSYNEGIRVANASNGYSILALGCDQSTNSGVNSDGNQWFVIKYPDGKSAIVKNGSQQTAGLLIDDATGMSWHGQKYNFYQGSLAVGSDFNAVPDGFYNLLFGTYYNAPNANCGTDASRTMLEGMYINIFTAPGVNGVKIQHCFCGAETYSRTGAWKVGVGYEFDTWKRLLTCEDLSFRVLYNHDVSTSSHALYARDNNKLILKNGSQADHELVLTAVEDFENDNSILKTTNIINFDLILEDFDSKELNLTFKGAPEVNLPIYFSSNYTDPVSLEKSSLYIKYKFKFISEKGWFISNEVFEM